MTRDEAKKRAECVAKVVPGATVRYHASNITVISKSGKFIVSYTGGPKRGWGIASFVKGK